MRTEYEPSVILAVDRSMRGDPSLGLCSKWGCVRYLTGMRRREGYGVGRGSSSCLGLHPVNRTSVTNEWVLGSLKDEVV